MSEPANLMNGPRRVFRWDDLSDEQKAVIERFWELRDMAEIALRRGRMCGVNNQEIQETVRSLAVISSVSK